MIEIRKQVFSTLAYCNLKNLEHIRFFEGDGLKVFRLIS